MSLNEPRRYLCRTCIFAVVPTLICALLYCLLLAPLEVSLGNNVLYVGSIQLVLVSLARQIVDMMLLFLCCAVSAFACYMFDSLKGARILVLLIGITVIIFKHSLNLFVSVLTSGWYEPLSDILTTFLYAVLDLLVLLTTYFIAHGMSRAHYKRADKLTRASKYVDGFEYNERDDVYPPKSILPAKHVILFPVSIGVLVYTLMAIASRVIYDISYGAPEDAAEVLTMVMAYLGDLILGVVAYFFSFLIVILLFGYKKPKADTKLTEKT